MIKTLFSAFIALFLVACGGGDGFVFFPSERTGSRPRWWSPTPSQQTRSKPRCRSATRPCRPGSVTARQRPYRRQPVPEGHRGAGRRRLRGRLGH